MTKCSSCARDTRVNEWGARRPRSPEQRRAVELRAYYDVVSEIPKFEAELKKLVDTWRADLTARMVSPRLSDAVMRMADRWALPRDRGAKDLLWSAHLIARMPKRRKRPYRLVLGLYWWSDRDLRPISPRRTTPELRLMARRARQAIEGRTWSQIAESEAELAGSDFVDPVSIRHTVTAWVRDLGISIPRRPRGRPTKES